MALEEFIDLNASGGSVSGTEKTELPNSACVISEPDPQPNNSECTVDVVSKKNQGGDEENQGRESILNKEELEQGQCVGGIIEGQQTQHTQYMELDKDLFEKPLQESILVDESIKPVEKVDTFDSLMNGENGFATVRNDSDISYSKVDDKPISGVKRRRVDYADEEPSVRVIYKSLTSASKRKLEEFLQLWSKWNAQHDSSTNKPHKNLVSGEETYFPALQVGPEGSSAVSFWIDDDTRKEQTNEIIRVDGASAPLYDRGFLLGLTSMDGPTNVEGGSEAVEASRCFNCSSYNHALKDCPKPRDHAAVNSARKEHSSKKNQTSGPHKTTRYYQSSSGGKYDGLRPGFLSPETRQLLGIGELDPPPWLNRMREIGYPPGYMDLDDEDQASGIKIYLDEETKIDEDGELSKTDEPEQPEQKKKMSVEFPGINAPIPENADERRWASSQAVLSFDPYRNRFNPSPTPSHSSEANFRGHYNDQRRPRDIRDDGHYNDQRRSRDCRDDGYYNDQKQSRDFRGDDVPPGCDPEAGISSFIPSYKSPNLGRSLSDRGCNPEAGISSFLPSYGSPGISSFLPSYGSPGISSFLPSYRSPNVGRSPSDRGFNPENGMSSFLPSYRSPGMSSFLPSYRSPSLGRSLSDRGRWDPSGNGEFSNQSPYTPLQHSVSDLRRSGHKRRFTETLTSHYKFCPLHVL